jgi:hypothetical protein
MKSVSIALLGVAILTSSAALPAPAQTAACGNTHHCILLTGPVEDPDGKLIVHHSFRVCT